MKIVPSFIAAPKLDASAKVVGTRVLDVNAFQEIIDYGSKKLSTDDYDEYCEECNQKAMR